LGSFTTRLLWSPPPAETGAAAHALDRVQWGDLLSRKVLGFVLLSDVIHVRPDPTHACRLTLYAVRRSVELEARAPHTRDRWIAAIRFFVEFRPILAAKQTG
jgi:hypothetical protein